MPLCKIVSSSKQNIGDKMWLYMHWTLQNDLLWFITDFQDNTLMSLNQGRWPGFTKAVSIWRGDLTTKWWIILWVLRLRISCLSLLARTTIGSSRNKQCLTYSSQRINNLVSQNVLQTPENDVRSWLMSDANYWCHLSSFYKNWLLSMTLSLQYAMLFSEIHTNIYIYIYIYISEIYTNIYIYIYIVLFGLVKLELGVNPSGQENHSKTEHLNFPGRELNVINITEQYFL